MEGERTRWRCRQTVYAICPPRPHRSVRRHAAFRLRPRARRSVTLCTPGPEAVPPPRRRVSPPRLSPHSFVLVDTRAWCCAVRVPAREVPGLRRELGAVLDLPQVAGRHDSHGAAVDERRPVRGLRSRACADRGWRHGLDEAVRLQRRVGHPPRGDSLVAARPGTVGPGAGRHELPRVVHGYRQGRRDEDERRRRARVLRVPSRAGLHRIRALACSRSQDDVRHDPLESCPGSRTARGAR